MEAQLTAAWLFARLLHIGVCRLLLRIDAFGVCCCSLVDLLQLVFEEIDSIIYSDLVKMRAKWGNAFYVASRKDMDAISEIYRERFIVAESQATGEILGTACYQTFVENYTHWNGEKLPENCWELFSLSVKPAARRLGKRSKRCFKPFVIFRIGETSP